jgi:hypothetical protein
VKAFACAAAALALVALSPACGDSVATTRASALEEPIRVGYFIGSTSYPAEFFPGDLPAPTGGPAVAGVDVGPAQAAPGKQGKGGYTVRLAKEAYSVAVRLEGRTNGYWIARVDQVEPLFDGQVSASLFFDVAPSVVPASYQLELSGVTGDRRYGARATAPLTVVPRVPPNAPAVIQLRWDSSVDLDLQVRGPDGTLLSPKHPTTAPVGTPDAGTAPGFGRLDGDSLASCVDDGLREENVVFNAAPAPGTYAVFVNAFDLCRQLGANYEVSILRVGNVQQQFFGRISEPEVTVGGFALGSFVMNVSF